MCHTLILKCRNNLVVTGVCDSQDRKDGLNAIQQPKVEFAFGMLLRDRVSAVITNQFNGLKFEALNIRRLEPAFSEKAYYLIFSEDFYRNHTLIAEEIWRKSGELQVNIVDEVLQKYAELTGSPEVHHR